MVLIKSLLRKYKNKFCRQAHVSENIGTPSETISARITETKKGWRNLLDTSTRHPFTFHLKLSEIRKLVTRNHVILIHRVLPPCFIGMK